MSDPRQVLVVGGGAAGLLCAGFAARAGCAVTVAEAKARPARKILVTGKGRCNLTNNCTPEEFLREVHGGAKFLSGAIRGWTPQDTMALFEDLGVPLKTERGRRVFPVSDRAMDVADALTRFCRESGVRIRQGRARALVMDGDRVTGVRCQDGSVLSGAAVVLATGGMSYPATGSDGSGYGLARQAGHRITPLRPSLVRVDCRDPFCADLSGLSLKNVALSLWRQGGKKPLYKELGEMLFTHTGVSGPLVLSASAYMDGAAGDYAMAVDLKPGLTPEQLDARLLRDLDDNKNRDLGNTLRLLLPRAMVPVVLALCAIPPDTKGHQLTRPQRLRLAETVKGFPLHPLSLGPMEEAVVTAGGVALEEVDPKTMASRLVGGLYFAGEMLDLDGYTGGYNLQIAFCTGRAAARGAAAQILLQEEPKNP